MTKPDLSHAYALQTPEDCLKLYADWADSYDADFARNRGYVLPAQVAAAFMAAGGGAPVLDVGAGTGLLGVALAGLGLSGAIDGIDLSPAMLDRAREKGCYRTLIAADVTRPLDLPAVYRGIVSSGTFTHGHVGPEGVPPLLDIALPGARFALSVNAGVWAARGFPAALDALADRIAGLTLSEVPIYDAAPDPADPHATDHALILQFTRR
ncbi:class I SAM-dependent methyltransferase [Pararhodobacter sp. SW119]|uniref:class I SAM-dependent DNA methyltransferase n=1 Tax=Pararhodobacter sp. SW119 TaxID=2780075 RepID=UPI001ADFF9ED|nr:class I SAM-dependent methyltransferase [Pararhodobacter sp. SW119]